VLGERVLSLRLLMLLGVEDSIAAGIRQSVDSLSLFFIFAGGQISIPFSVVFLLKRSLSFPLIFYSLGMLMVLVFIWLFSVKAVC